MLTKSELMGESTSLLLMALKLAHTRNVGSSDQSRSYEMSLAVPERLLTISTNHGCNLGCEPSSVEMIDRQLSFILADDDEFSCKVKDHSHHG